LVLTPVLRDSVKPVESSKKMQRLRETNQTLRKEKGKFRKEMAKYPKIREVCQRGSSDSGHSGQG